MSIAELLAQAQANVAAVLDSPRDIVAYLAFVLAAGFAVAGALVRTMIPLRWLAVGGNLGLVVYGALHPQVSTLIIASLLLPINVHRARQMMRLTRRVRAAELQSDLSGLWLRPYMKPRKLKAGTVLFRQGDEADRLYCLVDGAIELVEIGVRIEPGKIFGEIAFFAPDKRRTFTARCVEPATVLAIDEVTLKQLYFQNPAFGFHLIGLVAGRLSEDVRRIEKRFSGSDEPKPPQH
ncbi:MAG: cyclic nucleotide-binding domain-containing protein [Burkholderiales bacterium]|nr:cyclic nucleotide-binding domain-containing protein [Burkholderiales bacterium]